MSTQSLDRQQKFWQILKYWYAHRQELLRKVSTDRSEVCLWKTYHQTALCTLPLALHSHGQLVSLQILKKCTLWSYHAQLIKHKALHCWMIIRVFWISQVRLNWLLHAFTLPSIQQVSKINWKERSPRQSISSSCIQGKNVKHNSLHHYLENWVLGKTNSTRIHSESLGIETEFFIKAAKVSNGSFTLD